MTDRVLPYAEALDVPMGLVTYNGAVVLDGGPAAWTAAARRGLSAAARDAVFDLCREQGIFLNVYAQGRLFGYHRDGDFAWSHHYTANSGATYAAKSSRLEDLPLEGIEKLLLISTPQGRDRLHDEWAPRLAGLCLLTKSNPEYLEFLAHGVSKGSALEIWLAGNGLRPGELLAFGDAENDLEMLRLAGLGIAMANATPGLRSAHARLSRWSHAEDGVARELCDLYGLDFARFAAEDDLGTAAKASSSLS
jgi:HAD superfamily hydrolase (TIGR01484 family)